MIDDRAPFTVRIVSQGLFPLANRQRQSDGYRQRGGSSN
jgi:hypothetical protein